MQKVLAGGFAIIILAGSAALALIKTNKGTSKEQKRKQIQQLSQSICHQIYEFSQTIKIQEKKGKQYVCFIGPTSVGKSTLCNDLFKLNLQIGIGKTTSKIQKIYEKNNTVYFDSPGKDNDWQLFEEQDVLFFKSIDRCFLLYQGQVKEVKFIATLLHKMGKQLIFVRNQCDKHKWNMKPIDQVMCEDRDQLKMMGINFKAVIPSGFNSREEIKQWI